MKSSQDLLYKDLEAVAGEYGIEVARDLFAFPLVLNPSQLLSYHFVKEHRVLPIEDREGIVTVAIDDPLNLDGIEEARFHLKKEIKELLTSPEALDAGIEKCYHQSEDAASEYISSLQEESENGVIDASSEGYDLLDQKDDSPVIRILNVILAEAIGQGASDIHFEPGEKGLVIRYRIDGVLQLRHTPPKEYQSQLVTRIKVMARLDIAEHRRPQDGRIKLSLAGRQIDFRVSSVPVAHGERVVLRILDKTNILLGLDQLGMPEETFDTLNKLIRMSEGIVLVTGPTGSGKTTTLYSALSEIQNDEVNIMTIEDPVEYKLQGMAQIGVNPKIDLSFSKGLRHILRQDPDVIMIGEIRDRETAEIAIQSSLTGHLVMSTLHTNDAPSAITRLIDMGIEPYLLSSSVVGIIAQRLVRKICPHCKVAYKPSDFELLELGISRKKLKDNQLFKGEGCEACFHSGYKGRHGIYELLRVTSDVRAQIVKSGDASALQKVALKTGMKTLRESGAELAIKGISTSSEVVRVSRGCEEAL